MKTKTSMKLGSVILFGLLITACQKEQKASNASLQPVSSLADANLTLGASVMTAKIVGTGLNNPRGLKFGPDGSLYVAEGGKGGTHSSLGTCSQVPAPVGPYTGSESGGRISKFDGSWSRTTILDNLPSSQTSSGEISGVADIAFIGNTLYAITAGAGCSHGVPQMPNSIVKINSDKTWTMVANLSDWQKAHPVKNPAAGDFEPDGSWYSMMTIKDGFYAIEPNHGEMVKVNRSGDIARVIDISATQGHIVPTSITWYNGNFYVGNLNTFPIVEGSSNIYKISMTGKIDIWATGFTTVLGGVFDNQGRMYVLENTTGAPFPTPGTGKVMRIDPNGHKETIAAGLSLPTALTLGPDGNLYVSNVGIGPSGAGQIVQIQLK